jgi:hypothetical protein
MPKYRFDWSALPSGLLRQLQRELDLKGQNPADALKKAFGTRPTIDFVGASWPHLRERWVAKDPVIRRSVVSELRSKGLGDLNIKVNSARGEVAYLRTCRNSPTLRTVVLAHLLTAGEEMRQPKVPAAEKSARSPSVEAARSAWAKLSEALGLTLAQMEADQCLVLSVRDERGYYVQFAQGGPHGLRAETVSNAFLEEWERLDEEAEERLVTLGWRPPSKRKSSSPNYHQEWHVPVPYEDAAELAVHTLEDVLEVRHPRLLMYRAFAKGGAQIILPNLGLVQERPAPSGPPQPVTAPPEDLMEQVKKVMKGVLGLETIVTDNDGDIPVQCELVITYLHVVKELPMVVVFAPVIWDIGTPPDIYETLNEINSHIRFGRATWDGKGVVIAAEVVGAPLEEEQLQTAFSAVATLADDYAKQLQERYGGRVALGRALPPKQVPLGGYL